MEKQQSLVQVEERLAQQGAQSHLFSLSPFSNSVDRLLRLWVGLRGRAEKTLKRQLWLAPLRSPQLHIALLSIYFCLINYQAVNEHYKFFYRN